MEPNVLVVGDVMLDTYIYTTSERLSPEAPMPVFKETAYELRLGGAANVANNLKSLGSNPFLFGSIGTDNEGKRIKDILHSLDINFLFEEYDNLPTISKKRYLSNNTLIFRVDKEDRFPFFKLDNLNIPSKKENTVYLFSDYNKGTLGDLSAVLSEINNSNSFSIVDPKGNDFSRYCNADLITPNKAEIEQVCGKFSSLEILKINCLDLIQKHKISNILVTLGGDGMFLVKPDGTSKKFDARTKSVYDVTGAGDTVGAVLAHFLSLGKTLEESISLAIVGAGAVIGRLGTSTVSKKDLKLHDSFGSNYTKFLNLKYFENEYKRLKKNREIIVMTNGCFDLLHAGHIHYLKEARKMGDVLVVLINDDESVKKIKGPKRPINTLADRIALLECFPFVDYILSFQEKTPINIYEKFIPDVLVKGDDYKIDEIVGHEIVLENGGKVKTVEKIKGHSSTIIIKKIGSI